MKVLCPLCEQTVNLGYLEKKGDQMAYCANCNVTVSATFKKDKNRLYWEVYLERPVSRQQKPSRGGCGAVIWIAIALLILIVMAWCNRQVPDKPPGEPPTGELRN